MATTNISGMSSMIEHWGEKTGLGQRPDCPICGRQMRRNNVGYFCGSEGKNSEHAERTHDFSCLPEAGEKYILLAHAGQQEPENPYFPSGAVYPLEVGIIRGANGTPTVKVTGDWGSTLELEWEITPEGRMMGL